MSCYARGMNGIDENLREKRLLWLDLEMTGLDADRDLILEVAAIVTDGHLQEVARFESGVGHGEEEVRRLLDANPFYIKMKENKVALLDLVRQSPPETVVEGMLVKFIAAHCPVERPVVLAGNSIHMDRQFIRRHWPRVEQLLHYRMLDVTSWKLMFEAHGVIHKKKEAHRALDDIEESIAELTSYMEKVSW